MFLLSLAFFTDSDSSLDLMLRVDSNRFQMQIAHLKLTVDLLSAPCKWDKLSHYFWSLKKWEAHIQTYTVYLICSLQLKHILFVSFQIQKD